MLISGSLKALDFSRLLNYTDKKQIIQLMQNGEFTVIDATNSKTSEMNRYKELCSAYKYRMYCVDFTDIPIEVTKERNRMRPEVKQVPDEARRTQACLQSQI